MAEPYLKELRSIVQRVAALQDEADGIACKHFFSGAAAYVDGHIFMSLTPVGLALKLTQEARDALLAKGAKPLQYFPKAPVKKDYIVLPIQLRNDKYLSDWILRGIEFVRD